MEYTFVPTFEQSSENNEGNLFNEYRVNLSEFTSYLLNLCNLHPTSTWWNRTTCLLNTNDLVGIDIINKRSGDDKTAGKCRQLGYWSESCFCLEVIFLYKDGRKESMRKYLVKVMSKFNYAKNKNSNVIYDGLKYPKRNVVGFIELESELEEIQNDLIPFINHYLTIHGVKK